eukprot:1138475-Pelagomonas_calceolata.AAC.1
MPGIRICEKLPVGKGFTRVYNGGLQPETLAVDKEQVAEAAPHEPASDITAPAPCQYKSNLQLKVKDWKSWAYTDGGSQDQDGKTVIGAGVYHPMSDSKNLVESNGAGITNTIGRADLAAIAAALTNIRTHAHVATDSLSSLHQLRKQILYPEKHRHHVQGNVLKTILKLALTSEVTSFPVKVAKYQADLKDNNLIDNGVPSAGPGGNPSTILLGWLEKRQDRQRGQHTHAREKRHGRQAQRSETESKKQGNQEQSPSKEGKQGQGKLAKALMGQRKEKKRKDYASHVQLRALRKGPLTSKQARALLRMGQTLKEKKRKKKLRRQ